MEGEYNEFVCGTVFSSPITGKGEKRSRIITTRNNSLRIIPDFCLFVMIWKFSLVPFIFIIIRIWHFYWMNSNYVWVAVLIRQETMVVHRP